MQVHNPHGPCHQVPPEMTVHLGEERIYCTKDSGSDADFKSSLQIQLQCVTESFVEFDLIGVDASFANAIRRILIAEVPTMAIEDVFVHCNTSIIPDEVLSQRLGLLPVAADPTLFQTRKRDEEATDLNTVVFKLQVKCETNPSASQIATLPEEKFLNSTIYASHLEWIPQGSQTEMVKTPISILHPEILVAKLRPGQEIDLELHCIKGIGKDHAKWSPVGTATYRLMPSIRLLQEINGDEASKFAKCFPDGVVEVIKGKAVVVNPRKDTVSRECLRHPEFTDKVALERVRNHFIFTIESIGQLPAQDLLIEACKVLIEKCEQVQEGLLEITE